MLPYALILGTYNNLDHFKSGVILRLNCCSSDLLFLLQVIQPFIRKFGFDFGYDIRKRYTNKYGEMVVMWLLQLNVGLLLHVLRSSSLGQAPQWGAKEKWGQIGKISASEASPAVVWGGKSGQTSLGSLPTRRYLFSFFPQCEAWSQAIALLSIQVPIGALSFFLTFFLFPFRFL